MQPQKPLRSHVNSGKRSKDGNGQLEDRATSDFETKFFARPFPRGREITAGKGML
jgi:hypothetical protein